MTSRELRCPHCRVPGVVTRVIETRTSKDELRIRRRRVCMSCGKRFNTHEAADATPVEELEAATAVEIILEPTSPQRPFTPPSIGRIVHYVVRCDDQDLCRAAMITEIDELSASIISVCIFHPLKVTFAGGVFYDPDHAKGTWHWPERVS